jgi:hypothetical protein
MTRGVSWQRPDLSKQKNYIRAIRGAGLFGRSNLLKLRNKFMEVESKEEIIQRRKEIEGDVVDLLKETESDFNLENVKDAVYNEEETDDMTKIIAMFDRGGDASELDNILELVTDAWNYFPHKALNGLSPAEMILEYKSEPGGEIK